jgi:hypothetical protein
MAKRKLRIVKSAGGTPLQGICERCNLVFTATRDEKGFVSDKSEVRDYLTSIHASLRTPANLLRES